MLLQEAHPVSLPSVEALVWYHSFLRLPESLDEWQVADSIPLEPRSYDIR